MSVLPSIQYLHECFELRDDGTLIWRERPSHHFDCAARAKAVNAWRAGRKAGCIGKCGYWFVRFSDKLHPVHRVVYAMSRGHWPAMQIDHIDRNILNNRPDNLREATKSQNGMNRGPNKRNKLGLKGVLLHKPGMYRARIHHNGKNLHLGCFKSAEDAYKAFRSAELALRKEYAPIEPSK